MFQGLLTKIFGSRNQRLIKQYQQVVGRINALESSVNTLSDEALADKTHLFRERLGRGESLDALLPEAFAVCREASRRVMGMRHFDVQLVGGMVLHQGKIAEMRTGEGKTLMATLPAYLNALTGQGVHVVTVNDYLAARDADWMGSLYRFLGLRVGVILSQQDNASKHDAYAADITYGTNNEFGFDYLRDNMEYAAQDRRQRKLAYAIVDEVDSILIDEARTPLIISGQAEDQTGLYTVLNQIPPLLSRMAHEPKPQEPEPEGDYWVDLKSFAVHLSEQGHEHAEAILQRMALLPAGASLYDPAHIALMHHLMAALRAHSLYVIDQHYVVQNREVIIVDEFTGRLMQGRRWSDGLHQAIEAKENVPIQPENQTLASITFQNYFRMYGKLAGMTGTADTEAFEFQEIYGLETVVVPTHRPMIRDDRQDQVFRTAREKYQAILVDIRDCHARGQPVLVGTTSIENSELIASMLHKEKLPHQVLNAKQHAREAEIVAQAGRPGVITIATNMAGRGTDIVLGGNVEKQVGFLEADPAIEESQKRAQIEALRGEWQSLHDKVIAEGGLHIIGTERHESRRIDNQLRGRSGRQGDPGSSRFYLSMEDPLLKIFAGDRLMAIMDKLKLPDGEAIEAGMVSRSIESAQRKVEARNFDIRKQLLEYDDVANDQRRIIYKDRNEILDAADVRERIDSLRHQVLEALFREHVPHESMEEQWDLEALQTTLAGEWQLQASIRDWAKDQAQADDEALLGQLIALADALYAAKLEAAGTEAFAAFEKTVLLQAIDNHWRDHLSTLDYLRQGIHLRGYAQKNPKQEYKREAFELFARLQERIRGDVVKLLMTVTIASPEQAQAAQALQAQQQAGLQIKLIHSDAEAAGMGLQAASASEAGLPDAQSLALAAQQLPGSAQSQDAQTAQQPLRRFGEKIGRNDPCPCGSGKKFKQCHGRVA
ncbi:MAG: preprotein translocase subunit SecA [Betaproteobacteria bacterium]|jgi:preprotein translocase subunit SecA|nr:preprotein translocase subunit SecA [Pseudomonadota bacterium]NBO04557.1 preprotein translocase subunit SecA [Betaproteobacteria bacterium]NBP34744.1 preprotein translocase subunit SecA [Betaproteobacteria bacterium]NBP38704.1 preprotein translocase subunit SecA [Betaproteobacteria bacterium]NBY54094.1 preprotein translocase subunit SecA [Betaproteobacteria bacterium]